MSSPILSDHTRRGNRFIPPLLAATNFAEVSWVKAILPEVLWIHLLIDAYDLKRGVELAAGIAEAAQNLAGDHPRPSFAFSSDYGALSNSQKVEIVTQLGEEDVLESVQRALMPLHLYPQWPQSFLLDRPRIDSGHPLDHNVIQELRRMVDELLPRRERSAILTKATAVYIAVVSGKLVYTTNVTLPNLEAVVDYPDTEESRRVGASVGASINVLVGSEEEDRAWASYFWNRGLEIDRCQLEEDLDDE